MVLFRTMRQGVGEVSKKFPVQDSFFALSSTMRLFVSAFSGRGILSVELFCAVSSFSVPEVAQNAQKVLKTLAGVLKMDRSLYT